MRSPKEQRPTEGRALGLKPRHPPNLRSEAEEEVQALKWEEMKSDTWKPKESAPSKWR